jgi:hypothetical protein
MVLVTRMNPLRYHVGLILKLLILKLIPEPFYVFLRFWLGRREPRMA